ncbi:MAG: NmrA family NAD(P)-binding protein [Pseudomonadales bacterium]|nr:NmrA family NAD(P)-binding protein [Pseudomonadales bacterium]
MSIKKKTDILVIGGTGNVGTPLVELLKQANVNYSVLVRSEASEQKLKNQGVATVRGALGDWPSIIRAIDKVDTVFLLGIHFCYCFFVIVF